MVEKSQQFYKKIRENIKQKEILKEQSKNNIELINLKSNTKLGFLYEFTNETIKAYNIFIQCYNLLDKILPNLRNAFDIWEIKAFADCIMLKIIKVQFQIGDPYQALKLFGKHYSTYKQIKMEPEFEYMVKYRNNFRNINGGQFSLIESQKFCKKIFSLVII